MANKSKTYKKETMWFWRHIKKECKSKLTFHTFKHWVKKSVKNIKLFVKTNFISFPHLKAFIDNIVLDITKQKWLEYYNNTSIATKYCLFDYLLILILNESYQITVAATDKKSFEVVFNDLWIPTYTVAELNENTVGNVVKV